MKKQETGVDWIPISKDQPKTDGRYLTTTMYEEVHCDNWLDSSFNRTETVIAWAPMPEPYKWGQEKDWQNDGKKEG